MPKFIMCVGLPASGKSSYCEKVLDTLDTAYLASDNIRILLYNDVHNQTHNKKVFQYMNEHTMKFLTNQIDVIYDATNLNRTRRTNLLKGLPPCEKICYWFDTHVDECIRRDSERERHVGAATIKKMNCQLQVPTYDEGWDKIIIIKE